MGTSALIKTPQGSSPSMSPYYLGGDIMSDEGLRPEGSDNTTTAVSSDNINEVEISDAFREKFRLTSDEEVLRDVKPSFFAFLPLYFISVLILGAHLLFAIEWDTDKDSSLIAKVMIFLIDIFDIGEIGFVAVMLGLTWFNRMLNGSTSGKWITLFLLVVALTPPVLRLDDFIALIMDKDSGFIPLDTFNYTFFGIFWASLFALFTLFYQRSFHYAITNHRVIFTQHLIIPGDGRRILFDNIAEIRTQRTMMGAVFGYNTIVCDTGSQLGIGETSMSLSVGATGNSAAGDNSPVDGSSPGIFSRMFSFATYQRTRKVDLPDPRYSFFCITNWKAIEQLLNDMHQRHSQSGQLIDLKEHLTELNE